MFCVLTSIYVIMKEAIKGVDRLTDRHESLHL